MNWDSVGKRFAKFLLSPRGRFLAPIMGVLLTLPSLTNGLAFDDLLQRAQARGALGASLANRLDIFDFISADPIKKGALLENGIVPWFAASDLRLSFFRPLSAMLAFFDYNVLDGWPWLMHVESIALYACLIAVVTVAYRRLLSPLAAAVGALLFAVDDAHGGAVGWLADRNALLATGFGVTALIAHDRWRRDGWKAGAFAGPFAALLALLSAEAGVGAFAYIAAYAVTMESTSLGRRIQSLLPYGAVGLAWQIVYRGLGHGARASGLYLDPIAEPAQFLRAMPGHVASLLLGQLALPPADVYAFVAPAAKVIICGVAVAVTGLVAWTIAPRLRTDRVIRFFAVGALLALVPIAATFPMDRLLTFVGFGATGIGAILVGVAFGEGEAPSSRRASEKGLRGAWIGLHLVLSPLLLLVSCVSIAMVARSLDAMIEGIPAPPAMSKQTLILVNSPVVLVGTPLMFPLSPDRTAPARMRGLSSSTGPVEIRREDANTLVVRTNPTFGSDPTIVVFRDDAHPMRVGETFAVPGLRAEILAIDPVAGPTELRYRFDAPLEDASLRWITWNGKVFVDFVPPAVGTSRFAGPGGAT